MKKIIMLASVVTAVTAMSACASEQPSTQKQDMKNPAATFCVDQGGQYTSNKTDKGQVGTCTLSDGSQVDAWKYFRDNHK
ncbi:putative hemolysin [Vibrio rumoiensis]|uniref:Hemolysin n=1 Tax=Vibrio rumoiensis 1S-45 TaxID=1188252 RepID=A0A1E5DZ32_9VIBR|nr:DUF333 domain-containing protein [Vibrio rumoiensis]OEF22339.1 hypothetical protein A1QC_13985 [Vibrio rumoiensis 1S-45]